MLRDDRPKYYELELKLSGIPITAGLQPGGSRQVVFDIVNGMRGVAIDGHVQRIPVHDLKVTIRGIERHVNLVSAELRRSLAECDFEQVRYVRYEAWPERGPHFIIMPSASREDLKSDMYDMKPGPLNEVLTSSSCQVPIEKLSS